MEPHWIPGGPHWIPSGPSGDLVHPRGSQEASQGSQWSLRGLPEVGKFFLRSWVSIPECLVLQSPAALEIERIRWSPPGSQVAPTGSQVVLLATWCTHEGLRQCLMFFKNLFKNIFRIGDQFIDVFNLFFKDIGNCSLRRLHLFFKDLGFVL